MYALVVYDSQFGNTKLVAQVIAETLSGQKAAQPLAVTEASFFDVRGAELLVVGGPTQKHGVSPAMSAFLNMLSTGTLRNLPAAVFDTRYRVPSMLSGSAGNVIARRLKRAGATLIAPPESFFVGATSGPMEDGEITRAQSWAQKLLDEMVGRSTSVAQTR